MSTTTSPVAALDHDHDELLEALADLAALAEVHDRPDLAEAVGGATARLRAPELRVVVMGEFKQGKSSLVNALLDAPVAAVDDDVATAARLEVVYADRPGARRWWRHADAEVCSDDVPIGDVASASTDPSNLLVRAGLPRGLLRAGVVLVDTPGVGGISSAAAVVTASSLAAAHVALFVTDATQELTAAELAALVDAVDRGPDVIVVETKIDVAPHWRDVVAADCEHLARAGLDVPVVAVSSTLRTAALRRDDPELHAESGYGALVTLLRAEYLDRRREVVRRSALHTARRVARLLHGPLFAEFRALEDPAASGAAVERAQSRLDAFKDRAGRWQQTLGDGFTDLVTVVDHDLRDRFRALVRAAEAELDDSEPDRIWDEFEPRLYRDVATELDANLALLRERAVRLHEEVVAQLDDEVAADVAGDLAAALRVEETAVGAAERKEAASASAGTRAHQAFRAGYGGAMPIMAVGGMALGVLGLGTLVLPLAAVAGVVAGRKALADERDRQLVQRRQQAKIAVKHYLDEVLVRAGAERKAMQRRVQRTLRDHFTERVKELALGHAQERRAAEAAAAADEESRRARYAAVRDELIAIERVAGRIQAEGER